MTLIELTEVEFPPGEGGADETVRFFANSKGEVEVHHFAAGGHRLGIYEGDALPLRRDVLIAWIKAGPGPTGQERERQVFLRAGHGVNMREMVLGWDKSVNQNGRLAFKMRNMISPWSLSPKAQARLARHLVSA